MTGNLSFPGHLPPGIPPEITIADIPLVKASVQTCIGLLFTVRVRVTRDACGFVLWSRTGGGNVRDDDFRGRQMVGGTRPVSHIRTRYGEIDPHHFAACHAITSFRRSVHLARVVVPVLCRTQR